GHFLGRRRFHRSLGARPFAILPRSESEAATQDHRMTAYLSIALGGALGSMARYWCSGFVAERFGETFPWGTLVVNVAGSFIIGFFGTLTGPDGRLLVGTSTRQFVMVGICGGYTTFSS